MYRPARAIAYKPVLDEAVRRFVCTGVACPGSALLPLRDSLAQSSLATCVENNAWSPHIFVTNQFRHTVQSTDFSDDYLASPRWIVHTRPSTSSSSSCPGKLVILSDFEANELWPLFTQSNSNKLVLFSPRTRLGQWRMWRLHDSDRAPPKHLVEQVAIFAGSLYFGSHDELDTFVDTIGFCPSPRLGHLAKCFDRGLIEVNGKINISHFCCSLVSFFSLSSSSCFCCCCCFLLLFRSFAHSFAFGWVLLLLLLLLLLILM